jgi:hypothetical protein
MILKLLEISSRYYYYICNIIDSYSFIEKQIIPLNEKPLFLIYYYYIFCYYLKKLCLINIRKKNIIKYYEVTYSDNNIKRSTIINGNIYDVFEYTRYRKSEDKLSMIFKYNYFVNNVKTNIRNIIKKYDTKTKLYDIIYYNFQKDIVQNDINTNNLIEIEIGNNIYNINNLNKNLLVEDA